MSHGPSQPQQAAVSGAPIKVLITGSAGQIAYSLAPMVARGDMFGKDKRVIIHLLDIPGMEEKLEGLVMELQDLASDNLAGVVATTDYATAFADIDVALLVGARPRGPGMERKDLLTANANIFRGQGEALDKYAKKSVLVLVVGNPANTNALIASTFAPSIPRTNFSCLTRLDHNRARSMLASKLNVSPSGVKNVIIWGNHSATQFPDVRYAMVSGRNPARPHDVSSVAASLPEAKEWLRGEFITLIQQRGKAVIDRRGASSAASAAVAIVDHVRDWWCGSSNEIVSMGVYTDGKAYGVQANLIYSMPVICEGQGKVRVVTDLALDDFSAGKLKATETELLQERHLALPEQYPEAPPA